MHASVWFTINNLFEFEFELINEGETTRGKTTRGEREERWNDSQGKRDSDRNDTDSIKMMTVDVIMFGRISHVLLFFNENIWNICTYLDFIIKLIFSFH